MAGRLQIKFAFNTIEDRLLFCISEKRGHASRVDFRFWLTRRFVHIFMTAIDKVIEDELATDVQVSPDAIDAVKKFQHEAALAKADFSSSYDGDNDNCTALRNKPILVSTLKIKKKSKGKYVFSFLNNKKLGIHLTAGMDLVHSLQKMLLDSVKNAEWNKPLFKAAAEESKLVGSGGYIS